MLMEFALPFTPEQVAKMMGCEVTAVEEAARRGAIPGVKLGRSWRFPARALLGALDELAIEEAKKRREPSDPVGVQQKPAPAVRPGRKASTLPKLS